MDATFRAATSQVRCHKVLICDPRDLGQEFTASSRWGPKFWLVQGLVLTCNARRPPNYHQMGLKYHQRGAKRPSIEAHWVVQGCKEGLGLL